MVRRALVLLLVVVAAGGMLPAVADSGFGCTDDDPGVAEFPFPLYGTGRYALPAGPEAPTDLVVFAHGYGHTSASWVEHLKRTANEGAVAFGMDYRGTHEDAQGNVRGWFVAEGAEDSINTALGFLALCPSLERVTILGVSMGGNTSGLAVAAGATRADGTTPLFDHWIAVEPAANVIETYLEARAVENAVEFARLAREDIEAEHGGTLWEQPESYANGAVVLRAPEIAASGIHGVAVVHGFDDGLVPYNQGRELATLLRANGVPTDFYNVTQRETDGTECGSDNTTISENVLKPLLEGAGSCYTEPLAGHGTESSQTNVVIQTGLDVLFEILRGESLPANHEFVVDGAAGTRTQLP
jgi:pimeloyl-ACP methyl ester carboxylesterase